VNNCGAWHVAIAATISPILLPYFKTYSMNDEQ
jgi:hypothetical protein